MNEWWIVWNDYQKLFYSNWEDVNNTPGHIVIKDEYEKGPFQTLFVPPKLLSLWKPVMPIKAVSHNKNHACKGKDVKMVLYIEPKVIN